MPSRFGRSTTGRFKITPEPLVLRFLGEMEVIRAGAAVALPPSKKTRGLLAYLVLTGRPHRRERLCALLWDVADDPRGALRWSLSKLRPLVDGPGAVRLVADRDSVAFRCEEVRVDILAVRACLAVGVEAIATEELRRIAAEFRGELLEGLDLSDFHDFQAWCMAEREAARRERATVLAALARRLSGEPEEALAYARDLAQTDPFDAAAHVTLVRLLAASGRWAEGEQQVEAGRRMLDEMGPGRSAPVAEVWRALRERRRAPWAAAAPRDPAPPEPPPVESPLGLGAIPLVGRDEERASLFRLLDEAASASLERIVLLTGEPGLGKSRLLAELIAEARRRGGTVLAGCAYEAEGARPYGPWIDALRGLPAAMVGEPLAAALAPLRPQARLEPGEEGSREQLFGAVADLIAARAHRGAPVLLAFDDVQWCDDASAALLHYVARLHRYRPVVIALAARGGELPDNEALLRVLRGLRAERLVEELALRPLDPEDVARLARSVGPEADAGRAVDESGGNPLYVLEVARAGVRRGDDLPASLAGLVRDRIERLPPEAADLLEWAAVLGSTFRVDQLPEATGLPLERLLQALALLERHALLHAPLSATEPQGAYAFAHDVVRRAVHSRLSEPRRRLMHAKIVRLLQARGGDDSLAADLAHHAALAGEPGVAARACVAAGRRCLRLFAQTEAFGFARRGLGQAEALPEPEAVQRRLELLEVQLAARRPPQPEEAAHEIELLAERALDHGCIEHARLGFHLLGHLRWREGYPVDARRHLLRAEAVSRAADDRERVVALAEAARCLALLERDLGQAEALLLEAGSLSTRLGVEPMAIPDGVGMLRLHEGKVEDAAPLFVRARALARRDGDPLAEYQALEHLVALELQRGAFAVAADLGAELVELGDKLREGSEAPFARAALALARYGAGEEDAIADLDRAIGELRMADAKHRLAYVLARAAALELRGGNAEAAGRRAAAALDLAETMQRPSEAAMARATLARAAAARGDRAAAAVQKDALRLLRREPLSEEARLAIEAALDEAPPAPKGRRAGGGGNALRRG